MAPRKTSTARPAKKAAAKSAAKKPAPARKVTPPAKRPAKRPAARKTATGKPLTSVPTGAAAVAPAKLSLEQAAESGTERQLLVALRSRIAKTLTGESCRPADMASLSRRLMEITRELQALDAQQADGGDGIGEAAATPDEDFDEAGI